MTAQRTARARAADYAAAPIPQAWTAEHVELRLVEALQTIVRTTTRPGPRRPGGAHPETVVEFADLASLSFGETLERWMAAVEARAARMADPDELDRAHDTIRWLARYLADEPLQADALRLWVWATVSGGSIEEALAARRERADRLIERQEAQDRVRRARRAGARNPLAEASPVTRNVRVLRGCAAKRAAWANERIEERMAKLRADLAKLPKRSRSDAGQERLEARRMALITKAERFCARIRRSAMTLAQRDAVLTGAVQAKRRVLGLTRQDVMPGRVFHKSSVWLHKAAAVEAIVEALNREGSEVR